METLTQQEEEQLTLDKRIAEAEDRDEDEYQKEVDMCDYANDDFYGR